ncbi:MAG: hypothetical protein Q8P67_01770 [archaeon]|nr:hypothetical protein [archaeon]
MSVLFIGLEPYYLADVDTQDQIIQLTKPDQREHYQLHFPSPLSFSSWLSQLQQIFSAR